MNTDAHRLKNTQKVKNKKIYTSEISEISGYNTAMSRYKHEEITGQIIDAAHTVHNKLGYGFLEKVYHNSFVIELRKRKLSTESEKPVSVKYDNQIVGEYFADIIVDNKVIIEVKATGKYDSVFEAQLLNYLKATGLEVGLIINFARSVQVKRMVL